MARFAFGIFRLEPRGGLEDHCLRLAAELSRRGHDVTIFTTAGSAVAPVRTTLLEAGPPHLSNHRRMRRFAGLFIEASSAGFDRTLTFQPVAGADILFCADMPRDRADTPFWKRLMPRFRTYAAMERSCFSPAANTRILCLSPVQARLYRSRYDTPAERIAILPPSIDPSRRRPDRRNAATRPDLRRAFGIPEGACAWLWIGLQPKVKGLDRVIDALAAHAGAHLLIAGLSGNDRRAHRLKARARALDADNRLCWLGYLDQDRMLDALAAADLLAHPARTEVTGAVILEALINGLPVVTTENCGFAWHVEASGGGIVLPIPFEPQRFAAALARACGSENPRMSADGMAYGASAPLYDGIAAGAALIASEEWPAPETDRSARR